MRLCVVQFPSAFTVQSESYVVDGRNTQLLSVMKIPSRHVSLFLLSSLFYASSLYLKDYGRPKLHKFLNGRNEHLSHSDWKTRKFHQSRKVQETVERGNGNDNKSRPNATGTFINCVFNVDSDNQPNYDCKYSQDVKINWTREDGRLMGSFSANFHCPKRREVRNKMQSPQKEVGGKRQQLIRDKRRIVYRDDADADEARGEEAQDIEEEEVNQAAAQGEESVEDSQVPRVTDVEEEIPDEEDNEHPVDGTEGEDGNEDKGLKEVNIGLKSPEDSVVDKGDPGEEGGKEVNEMEEQEDDEADIVDKEVPGVEVLKSGGGEDNGDREETEDVPDSGAFTVDREEPIEEASTKDENSNKTNEEGQNGESEDEKGDAEEDDNDKKDVVKESADKPDAEGSKAEEGDKPLIDYEPTLVPIELEIELIVSQSEMPLLIKFIQELLYEAGDYLLSLLTRGLKQRLRQGRIEEKFNRKVETLSKNHGNDTDKALLLMKKKIHQQLGKSYQLEIVRYLKQLHESLKQ